MKSVSVSGSLRENVGKKDAKAMRAQGLVPCVVYGGKQQYHIAVDEKQFKDLLYTPEVNYADITIGDYKTKAIVKATQFHPLSDSLVHVDFLEIDDEKQIVVSIPVKVTGNSPGVIRGGKLIKRFRNIKAKGLYNNIPDYLTIDISKLDIGDAICVKDIVSEKFSLVENPANIIVSVDATRNVETPTEG